MALCLVDPLYGYIPLSRRAPLEGLHGEVGARECNGKGECETSVNIQMSNDEDSVRITARASEYLTPTKTATAQSHANELPGCTQSATRKHSGCADHSHSEYDKYSHLISTGQLRRRIRINQRAESSAGTDNSQTFLVVVAS